MKEKANGLTGTGHGRRSADAETSQSMTEMPTPPCESRRPARLILGTYGSLLALAQASMPEPAGERLGSVTEATQQGADPGSRLRARAQAGIYPA